ncbi:MAG: MarR family transcriptional regulator [Melioribacteraceae bacterium]|nr:MAG: MarR family transcriptional regulator [Melioribacteraceae bacterium]
MKLEEEINQTKNFSNEFHKLAVNIIYTHGWLMQIHSEVFKGYGITVQQYNILRILRGQNPEPVTVNELKERMLDKMSDVSRLVERLRVKELVERKICPDDRRRAEVTITKKGLDLLGDLDSREEIITASLSSISENEAKKVNDLLDKMRG